ncbi:hypothetical protein [Marinisporobacter balticus]|uniref:Uncharacterized protein n=1 Tax=Marinisporobacter balticus TaxID=2018667 RepID=A0A4R2KFJ0_9FIRM|nr:hypothetical protein [Marinisporobacter balticus]TCO69156.1 hypothetical protein EV214_13416 [Marinisporobacter balticus]
MKKINLADITNQMAEGEIFEIKDAFVGRIQKQRERIIIYKLTK